MQGKHNFWRNTALMPYRAVFELSNLPCSKLTTWFTSLQHNTALHCVTVSLQCNVHAELMWPPLLQQCDSKLTMAARGGIRKVRLFGTVDEQPHTKFGARNTQIHSSRKLRFRIVHTKSGRNLVQFFTFLKCTNTQIYKMLRHNVNNGGSEIWKFGSRL